MDNLRFVSNAGNHVSKGYILENMYEAVSRVESKNSPGKFIFQLKGPGLPEAGIKEWEEVVFDFFMFNTDSKYYPAQLQYRMKKGLVPPAATPPPAAVQPTPTNTAGNQAPPPSNQQVQLSPSTMMVEFSAIQKRLDAIMGMIKPAAEAPATGNKDILLAGLAKMDFTFLNLKLAKTEGKITMTIIVDGLPFGLSINSGDIAAESVLNQILDSFGKTTLISSAITSYTKALKELQTAKEAELKKEKEAAKKSATKKEDKTPAATATTPKFTGTAQGEAVQAEAFTAEIPPIDEEDPDNEPDPTEDPNGGLESNQNGLSESVGVFKLD